MRTSFLAAIAVAAALQTARLIGRLRRELGEYRKLEKRLTSLWVTIPGVAGPARLRLHARVSHGPPGKLRSAVLVHGFGVGSAYNVPLAAELAASLNVYAPELPGHGKSDHDTRPLSVTELATALAAWMDAAAVGQAILVCHSFGCLIGAELAMRRPQLVSRLVLLGPTSDPAVRTPLGQVARAAITLPFERPSFVALGLIGFAEAGPRVLLAELREMLGYRIEEVFPRVEAPVQIVRGARDAIAPQRWAALLARLAGAPPPLVVPGWGHAVNYSAPGAVARAVIRHCQ